jgi:hypothetical protein
VLENEQVRQKHEWQCSQLSGLEGQLKRTGDEIRQTQTDLAGVDKHISSFQEQVREGSRALAAMPLEELHCCPKRQVAWNKVECPAAFPGVKAGLAEEILSMLEAGAEDVRLPDLAETAGYIATAERIFGYDSGKEA